ncbi:hypothetical protein CYMTET_34008 [Cymbomonas tetramitiformis]|uniref:Uncharacterized protein n=1 Tax=Cymbomonas tetramitiformis TaxID=36881 RepID=A0AAE0FBZ3_9CHLO|nr:hypothetical protein CYMTET_34008 [Cymbomonas tetramitiformis]
MPDVGIEYVAGVLGGAAGNTTGHPFDTVKVNLQKASVGQYKGPLDCLRTIVRTKGIKGLYVGLSAPLVGGSLECGVNYAVFAGANKLWEADTDDLQASGRSLRGVVVSGAFAGGVLSSVLTPTELVKCRLQAGPPPGQAPYKGPFDVISRVLASQGVLGLWRGLGATLIREVPGNAIFFTAYEIARQKVFPPESAKHTEADLKSVAKDIFYTILSGGIAGSVVRHPRSLPSFWRHRAAATVLQRVLTA